MWPWSKKKEANPNNSLRETLFGDMPLSTWAGASAGEPWTSFSHASVCLGQGDRTGGIAALQAIVFVPGTFRKHRAERAHVGGYVTRAEPRGHAAIEEAGRRVRRPIQTGGVGSEGLPVLRFEPGPQFNDLETCSWRELERQIERFRSN